MADRFFLNSMPNFVPGEGVEEKSARDSLTKLINLPYEKVSDKLKRVALDLKEIVVRETWKHCSKRVQDFTLYTGVLGTAYLCFQAYRVTNNRHDLDLCSDIVMSCDSASRSSGRVTFLCGRAGVLALGAVAAHYVGDKELLNHYLTLFKEIKIQKDLPDELLYGRGGFLWACSFLNKHLGKDMISAAYTRPVVDDIMINGRHLAGEGRCRLMYEWHGKKYWGAAHGLAGIMHVLMGMELRPDESEEVKSTLRYMIRNRFPDGNYKSSEGSESDRLVHWCHGAPGVALTLVKAAQVFGGKEFEEAAINAGEVVWKRGLLKRVGICHGISGNTYVFLSLFRLTGNPLFLYRAKAFASFLAERGEDLMGRGEMHGAIILIRCLKVLPEWLICFST